MTLTDRHGSPIRAVLFDVDGTLYHQAPVRALIAAELAVHAGVRRIDGPRTIRALRMFRRMREELRAVGHSTLALTDLQFQYPAERIGESPEFVRRVVEEWMFTRPLKYLRVARRRDVISLVRALVSRDLPVGALSDYPAEDKLRVLGVGRMFRFALCTTAAEINAFKPHPRGFLHACDRLGLSPRQVAYVGDRLDADAAGAAAAGMPCYVVGDAQRSMSRKRKDESYGCREFSELDRLCRHAA